MSVAAESIAPAVGSPSQSSFTITSSNFNDPGSSRQQSLSVDKGKAPERANGPPSSILTSSKSSLKNPRPPARSTTPGQEGDDSAQWGSNFWVTLVDPQTQTSFFACPATGQVSWDPPAGNFVLPPSTDGEWWELSDDSRGGIPYYYQTKTGETVWERPSGFVIPLGILQNTALGRRLSTRLSKSIAFEAPASTHESATNGQTPDAPPYRRSKSFTNGQDAFPDENIPRTPQNGRSPGIKSTNSSPGSGKKQTPPMRRAFSSDPYNHAAHNGTGRLQVVTHHLPTIPASPNATDASDPPTPSSQKSPSSPSRNGVKSRKEKDSPPGKSHPSRSHTPDSVSRSRSKSSSYVTHRPPPPQSLNAAVEMLTSSHSDGGHGSSQKQSSIGETSLVEQSPISVKVPQDVFNDTKNKRDVPPSPRRPIPATPHVRSRFPSAPTVAGKGISGPIPNHAATLQMSPVKNRATGKPIPVEARVPVIVTPTPTLNSGIYPVLPHDLASDIQLFSESDYARQYFSTHRTGFIFRRRVPVAQMMTWQKAPLTSPLLTLFNRSLNKEAVKIFKVIQRVMGDRERERGAGTRVASDNHVSIVASINASTASLAANTAGLLEEERWLLGEGLSHGELRDEIYCQTMKQLTGNPSAESIFKGWQLLCVLLITFPPSKNFETYLCSFMQQHTTKQEGRVDVMAKYCLRRLTYIAQKGPRGKPPTTAEIETASDAAFHPSTFGQSLDAIIRLQERNYPEQQVPIILPFLADGILALGGTKSEGIFRIPGDSDSVSELKLRIDKGYYTLDGVDDPHILASLMKLWLRELCDPLVPEEMYNECITSSRDPDACVQIVERLPTINRRVVLFVISFLQLFLEDRTQSITKMTPANLALVMAPNLLRCNSGSMSIVYNNAQYEQLFVYNLLLKLKCGNIDANYTPAHGLEAVPAIPASRTSKSKSRRLQH